MFSQPPARSVPAPRAQREIDELDRAIVNLSARINAASHDLLVLIRRFDERGGWLRWGFENCADWLHWRCDLSVNTAREKVRVAHALKTLPHVARHFAEGRLSYSKVRALTRVADRSNESELLEFALKTTAACVEARCQELRCGTADSLHDANRAHDRRSLVIRRDAARGSIMITVELPLEQGELVDKALDRARDAAAENEPELPAQSTDSWSARQADALVAMATEYLSGSRPERGVSDYYRVMVHVDQAALAAGRGRAGLPLETVRRLACDGSTIVVVEDEDGEPLNAGRKSRTVPAAIRRALWARDRHCRFPGCRRTRFCDAHHVEHWANGGETNLGNLLLLCTQHHRLVHEGGFRIEKDYRDRWFFKRPDGRAVPACGYRPGDVFDDDVDASAEAWGGASAEAFSGSVDNRSARPRAMQWAALPGPSP